MSAAENKAVFLSYASQDSSAANKIADALRAAGVEVWFDQNELTGGDAWDAKIRKQIADCALFVPLISAATQARREGYFRLEWRIAAQRTHMMSEQIAFLLPVVIDATRDAEADVPGEFKAVQWTRLPGGETPDKFCARVKDLLSGNGPVVAGVADPGPASARPPTPKSSRSWLVPAIVAVALLAGGAGWWMLRPTASTSVPKPAVAIAVPGSDVGQLVKRARDIIYDPDSARAEFALAESLLKRAIDLAPDSGSARGALALLGHYFYSRAYDVNKQRLVNSQAEAEKALQLDPRNTDALLALGLHRDTLGDKDRARDYIDRALAADPQNFKATLAQSLLVVSNSGARAKFLLEAAQTSSHPAELYYYASANFVYARNYEAARQANERAIAAQPFWRTFVNGAAIEHLQSAAPEKIDAWLDRVPELKRDEPRVAILRYRAAMLRHDGAAAVRVLNAVAADYFEDNYFIGPKAYLLAQAHELAGKTNEAAEQWALAEKVIRERLAAEPGVPQWRPMLAIALAAEHRLPEAKALAVSAADDERVVHIRVACEFAAQALVRVGEPAKAMRLLRQKPANDYLGDTSSATLAAESQWEALRADPRFAQFLADLKREEAADGQSAVGPTKADENSASAAKSVAVLAFKNLSGDPAREFFSDGLSEAVTDVLGRVPGLKVVGSASAFSFKGKSVPIPEIARQLGVSHVVEGTVLQEGQTVRITAKLIKADGFQVWVSDKLDRELKNIFALHDEVAGLIAKNLSLQLGANSPVAMVTVNPQVFELFVRGREAWKLRTLADYDRAEDLLNRALALEPNFARAHAAVADVWFTRAQDLGAIGGFGQRNSPEHRRIVGKINQALALDPDSAEAHASLGGVAWVTWQSAEGERELRRAIALNPNYATAHQWLGRLLLNDGRMDEALAELKLAAEIDPLAPRILDNYGMGLGLAGRSRKAIAVYDRALALQPNSVQSLRSKAQLLAASGRLTEAVAVVQTIPLEPANPGGRVGRVRVFAQAGMKAEAEALLPGFDPKNDVDLIDCLLALGRNEEAVTRLVPAKLFANSVAQFLFDSFYDSIRNDPRLVKLRAEVGLNEAHDRAQAWRKAHPPEKAVAK